MSVVYFGDAWVEYCTLEVKPPAPEQVFKSRPSQVGSDAVTFEASARNSVGQGYLFGNTFTEVRDRLTQWTAMENQVGVLFIQDRGGWDRYDQVLLRRARPLRRPRRIMLATNGANWQHRIELHVARLK